MSSQYPQQPKQPVYSATAQMNPQVNEQVGAPQATEAREWKFGLFDCFADCGLCIYHIVFKAFVFFFSINYNLIKFY